MAKGKRKGRPQLTGIFWDPSHNRMSVAYDAGWGEIHWARLRREALIQAVNESGISTWRTFTVTLEVERNGDLRQILHRAFNKEEASTGYLAIRAKSALDSVEVKCHYFVYGLKFDESTKNFRRKYGVPTMLMRNQVVKKLDELLQVDLHPGNIEGVKNVRRFSASASLKHKLEISRMKFLIDLNREKCRTEFVEQTNFRDTSHTGFIHEMAKHIKADRPLIYRLAQDLDKEEKQTYMRGLLTETGKLDASEIEAIIEELVNFFRSDFKLQINFRGIPADAAEMDRRDSRYTVYESPASVMSYRIEDTNPEDTQWDLVSCPTMEDDIQVHEHIGEE